MNKQISINEKYNNKYLMKIVNTKCYTMYLNTPNWVCLVKKMT